MEQRPITALKFFRSLDYGNLYQGPTPQWGRRPGSAADIANPLYDLL